MYRQLQGHPLRDEKTQSSMWAANLPASESARLLRWDYDSIGLVGFDLSEPPCHAAVRAASCTDLASHPWKLQPDVDSKHVDLAS